MDYLLDWTRDQLTDQLAGRGLPTFRAKQIWRQLFVRGAESFEAMTDLPAALRATLAEHFTIRSTEVAAHKKSDDGAEKLLLTLHDGARIECVLLRDDRGHRTVCLSTQVGCAMGCVFCASGLDGVERNLSRGEILEQALRLQALLPTEERISHVVIMGMGEPLANLDALLPALDVVRSDEGFGVSARRITISTVGLPPGIRRLAEHDAPYHLAVSLHAPVDPLRNELIPANRKIGIDKVLAAADEYFEATGRRVTYEYVLLRGVNDGNEHAERLAALLQDRNALVNVIPYNPVEGLPFDTPHPSVTTRFVEILTSRGVQVKVRWRKGDRIDAACGQLRRQRAEKS